MPSPLQSLLGKWRRTPRRSIDLNLIEQRVLLALFRFNQATGQTIYAEVTAQWSVDQAEVLLSLSHLEQEGLVEAAQNNEGGRLYKATKAGRRLRKVIPSEPKSVIAFWP